MFKSQTQGKHVVGDKEIESMITLAIGGIKKITEVHDGKVGECLVALT